MHAFWDFVSKASVIGFAAAVVLAILGRWLFVSNKRRKADLGTKIISSVGGARNSRFANEEFDRRKSQLR